MRKAATMQRTALAICAALAMTGTAAQAAAPQPKKAFDQGRMPGRWYELARLPSAVNKGCQAPTTDWTAAGPDRFEIAATCRKGAPDGPARIIKGRVDILDPGRNTKVRMKVFGGLISQDYWLLDRAADYSWLIMGTPNGSFISISATTANPSPALKAEAVARAKALGYDTSRLIYPRFN
jgi:apolipoprotein D and lipocalin family protein